MNCGSLSSASIPVSKTMTMDPVLHAALHEAIAYADAHPEESKSVDEVRALIPKWISESKSQSRP
jgi:hypothetical protein